MVLLISFPHWPQKGKSDRPAAHQRRRMAETNSSPITTERSDGYVWTVRPEPEIGPQTLRPEEATGITVARERAHGPRRQRFGSDDILQLPGRAGPPEESAARRAGSVTAECRPAVRATPGLSPPGATTPHNPAPPGDPP